MALDTIYQTENCEWIDCEAATAEDFAYLKERFKINPLLLEDTVDVNHLPKYEEEANVKFFLMRENIRPETKSGTLNGTSDISTKLSIFVLDGTILTIHRMKNPSIYEFREEIKKLKTEITPDLIALNLALKVLNSYDKESVLLMDKLEQIETDIFLRDSKENHLITRLYRIKRKAGLNLKILNVSSSWVNYFRFLDISHAQYTDLQDKHKDVISDFEHLTAEVNNLISMFIALSDQKANQVMKLLAIYSVYFLPITFIAGLYGMNFEHMPELRTEYGYYITLGIMALIVIITFIYSKKKKW